MDESMRPAKIVDANQRTEKTGQIGRQVLLCHLGPLLRRMLDAQDFYFLDHHPIDHDMAFVRQQLVGAVLAASAAAVRMCRQRCCRALDEVNHLSGAVARYRKMNGKGGAVIPSSIE